MTTMTVNPPAARTLSAVEAQYRSAIHRLLIRLALIVSISGMAQVLSHYIFG